LRQAPDFFIWIRRNPLKSPNSAKEMQGNARIFPWFFLAFPCTILALRLSRGLSDQALTAPVRRGGFRCGMAEAQAKIASRRLTFIVKHQNLSMPLMRASLPLRKPLCFRHRINP
jgi:hypothetical protein